MSVGAVVAAFRPGDELVAAVETVIGQVGVLVVVSDEAPGDPTTRAVLDSCATLGAEIVEHEANRGIGAALNSGLAHLRAGVTPPTYVLTLDQDSTLEPGYVAALVAAVQRAEQAGVRVGMVAPDRVGSMVRRRSTPRGGVAIGGEPIQSGLLVPLAALDRLDGFDESLFIDGVDTDFYLRARDAGLSCVVAPGTRLEHRLGAAVRTGTAASVPLTVASTFRYHYQWRNLVALLRRHARRHPGWAAGAVLRALRHLAIVTVMAPGRRARLREAAAGLRAGLRHETGRRPD